MSTGQGITWVVVADAQHARVLEVEDAGLPPRLRTTIEPPPPEPRSQSEHGWTHGDDPHAEHERRRFVKVVDQALVHGLAENRFQHLVLVAEPRMLGLFRESLSKGLADRLRKSVPKDWAHVPETELAEHVRPLVEIWPR